MTLIENSTQPIIPIFDRNTDILYFGLTKREYFAAMAMQGIVSNPNSVNFYPTQLSIMAEQSINIADELLKQLDNGH